MKQAITKNGKILAIFAIACTAIVGFVNHLTKERIAEQANLQLLNTLNSIIDANKINNDLTQDCIYKTDPLLGSNEPQQIYLGHFDDKPVAAAITTIAPDGYNGNITLLVAFNYDGSISGVRTLKHQETPGLGDKIERRKSNWLDGFADKTIEGENDMRWAVKKDGGMFDQFTGATITPRAVVKAIKKAGLYFQAHKTELFAHAFEQNNTGCKE